MTSLQDFYGIGYGLDSLIRKMVVSGRRMIEAALSIFRALSITALEIEHDV